MDNLAPSQFVPETTYLNTASAGLLPARSVTAVQKAAAQAAAGRPPDGPAAVEAARAAFARLVDVPADRVATGSSVAGYAGLIATSLPAGAEVLVADGDFSSLVTPFVTRPDLTVRGAPLERLAEEVRPSTALVAVSLVQSSDGRIADVAAVREAARAHGARTLCDVTQAVGWLPVAADEFDYTVCVGFKWLLGTRGTAFLVVPDPAERSGLLPVFAGWAAGAEPRNSYYGPVAELARTARRFDESPGLLPYIVAAQSLAVVEEVGTERIGAHNRALADRFRAGLERLGHPETPAAGSAIVAVRGWGRCVGRLAEAGVIVSDRGGDLRAAFHLYNSAAEVDRLLDVLGDSLRGTGAPRADHGP